jgi:hypothetical protein
MPRTALCTNLTHGFSGDRISLITLCCRRSLSMMLFSSSICWGMTLASLPQLLAVHALKSRQEHQLFMLAAWNLVIRIRLQFAQSRDCTHLPRSHPQSRAYIQRTKPRAAQDRLQYAHWAQATTRGRWTVPSNCNDKLVNKQPRSAAAKPTAPGIVQ